MAMINFADKVALNVDINVADINKVDASDLNELKNAFNNQVAVGWYKTGINPTFTYVSYDSTTKTGVVSSNLDLTSYLSPGMKIKFDQDGTTKYAILTEITSTQLTLFLGTDYTINNSAITNTFYSMLEAPYGFPIAPVTLYDNLIGDNGNITLNSSAENYSYIEIFYRDNDSCYSSTKVASPNGKKVSLNVGLSRNDSDGTNYWYSKTKIMLINGTSMTNGSYTETRIGNNKTTICGKSNNVFVTKVLGYKY